MVCTSRMGHYEHCHTIADFLVCDSRMGHYEHCHMLVDGDTYHIMATSIPISGTLLLPATKAKTQSLSWSAFEHMIIATNRTKIFQAENNQCASR